MVTEQVTVESVVHNISNLINEMPSDCAIYIYIDEVSLTDGNAFSELSIQLLSLVTYHTNRMDTANFVRFIVASGLSPKTHLPNTVKDKFNSLFTMFSLAFWSDEDIRKLLRLVCSGLSLNFSTEEEISLVAFAKGSPRRLKDCLRKYVILQRTMTPTVDKAIAEAGHEEVA